MTDEELRNRFDSLRMQGTKTNKKRTEEDLKARFDYLQSQGTQQLNTQPAPTQPIGQYGAGNINLYNRPIVNNPDGTTSTVRSMSFSDGKNEILIPTVVNGKIVSNDEAIDNYYKTGEYLGKFNTVDEANAYAENLHKQQEKLYSHSQKSKQGLQQAQERLHATEKPMTAKLQSGQALTPEETIRYAQEQGRITTQEADKKLKEIKEPLKNVKIEGKDNSWTVKNDIQEFKDTIDTIGKGTVVFGARTVDALNTAKNFLELNDPTNINAKELANYAKGERNRYSNVAFIKLQNIAERPDRQDDMDIQNLYKAIVEGRFTGNADDVKNILNKSQNYYHNKAYQTIVQPSLEKYEQRKQQNIEQYPGMASTIMNTGSDILSHGIPTVLGMAANPTAGLALSGGVTGETKMQQYLAQGKDYTEAAKNIPIETAKGLAFGKILEVASPFLSSGIAADTPTLARAARAFANGFIVGTGASAATQSLDLLKDDPNYDYIDWNRVEKGLKTGEYKSLDDYLASDEFTKDVAGSRAKQMAISALMTAAFNTAGQVQQGMRANQTAKAAQASNEAKADEYLKTLGLKRGATEEQVRKAARQLSAQFHPDRNPGFEEQFNQVRTAYAELSKPEFAFVYGKGVVPTTVAATQQPVNTTNAVASDQALVPYAGQAVTNANNIGNMAAQQATNIVQPMPTQPVANMPQQTSATPLQTTAENPPQAITPNKITTNTSLENIRDFKNVGNRNVKAYQFENPEVKPFFQYEAKSLLDDLNNAIKGEKWANWNNGELTYGGTKRAVVQDIADLLDGNNGVKLSYDDIKKGLNAIIENHGSENIAAAKRIEMVLDKRLREGYTDYMGYEHNPSENYNKFLSGQEYMPPAEYDNQYLIQQYGNPNDTAANLNNTQLTEINDYIKNISNDTTLDNSFKEQTLARFDNLNSYRDFENIKNDVAEYKNSNQDLTGNESNDLPDNISIKDSKGREIDHKIHTHSTSAYSDQVNMLKYFEDEDGNTIAKVDYSYYDGKIYVNMIETLPEYRRKGLATRLIKDLENDAKEEGMKIDYGYTTRDGTAFLEKIKQPKQPSINVPAEKKIIKDNRGRQLTKQQQNFYREASPKARDSQGQLLNLYHTTPAEFNMFDNSKLGENTGYNNTAFGIFVTPNKAFSSRFGDIDNEGKNYRTLELYTNAKRIITHPFNALDKYQGKELDNIVIEYIDATAGEIGLKTLNETLAELREYDPEATYYDAYETLIADDDAFENAEEERKQLEAKGYDGVEFVEGLERDLIEGNTSKEPVVSFALFNGNNLKSATNTNPQNTPDINDLFPSTDELKQFISDQDKAEMAKIGEMSKGLRLEKEPTPPIEPPEPPTEKPTEPEEIPDYPDDKIAQLLKEKPQRAKMTKKEMAENAYKTLVNKGYYVDKLAEESGNPQLKYKYDRMLASANEGNYVVGEKQTDNKGNIIGKSVNEIWKPVEDAGKVEEFSDYLLHKLNINRMSLEDIDAITKADTDLTEFIKNNPEIGGLSPNKLKKLAKGDDANAEKARQLIELDKQAEILENRKNKPVFGETVTADDSRKIVAEYEKNNPEFVEWSKDISTFNKNQLQNMVDAGLASEETQQLLNDMYDNYIRIQREVGGDRPIVNQRGRLKVNSPIKKAKGGNQDILPLKDSMAQQAVEVKKAISRNLFGQELLNTIGGGEEVEDYGEILNKGKNGEAPTFTVFKDGNPVTMKINTELYDTIKPSERATWEDSVIANGLQKAVVLQKTLLTSRNPIFAFTNFVRDLQTAVVNSTDTPKMLNNYRKLAQYKFAQTFGRKLTDEQEEIGRLWELYKANGGESNTYFDFEKGTNLESSNPVKRGIDKFTDKVFGVNEIVEQMPRVAEFITTLENGGTIDEAMYNAADITVNFKRGGEFTKMLDRNGASFLNASVQGLDKQIRNFSKKRGGKGFAKMVITCALLGIAPQLLNHVLLSDDEDYQDLPDYVKDNYWLFKTGDNTFIRIPRGRDIPTFLGVVAQRTKRATEGDDHAFDGLVDTFKNTLAPNNPAESNIYSPIDAVFRTGKSWSGNDIVSSALSNKVPSEQYDAKDTEFAKWLAASKLGKQFGWSPKKIDYLLDQYSGGIGDILIPMNTKYAEEGNPLSAKFMTDSVTNNKQLSRFYDTKTELAQRKTSGLTDDTESFESQYLNNVGDKISKLSSKRKDVEMSDLPDKEKIAQARELTSQINEEARNANNSYKKLGETYDKFMVDDALAQFVLKNVSDDKTEAEKEVMVMDAAKLYSYKEVLGGEYAVDKLNLSDKMQEKYEDSGIDADIFFEAYMAQKYESSDKDTKDKTIPLSKDKNRKTAIDNAVGDELSKAKKEELYGIFNISEKVW